MASQTPTARDEFPSGTKIVIARRTNYYCAICGCATAGPAMNPLKATNIGVAAHITAAASGGPRYDASLTPEQRSAADNGVWCCQNCGKEVDDDESKYSVENLRALRGHAEQLAGERLGIRTLRGHDLANAEHAARSAARILLGQWQTLYHFDQRRLVRLDLRVHGAPDDSATVAGTWRLEEAIDALSDGRSLVLLGRPGAGKTMTLLQAADALLARTEAPIPIVFSVDGWVASGHDLTHYVADRLTNLGVDVLAVPLLLKTCRLALFLNGWNEAPEADQARANAQLRDFVLNHPGTPLALTTRGTRSRPAVPGISLLEVRPLSAVQKVTIARVVLQADADRFLAQLEDSPLLEEVTDTPLFLSAALKLAAAGRPLPATRSGLLGSFVAELEGTDNHAVMLQAAPCYGFHRIYLAGLARVMTEQARTALGGVGTLSALASCSRALVEEQHLGVPAASTTIAESLVRHHALVLIPGAEASYAFVHQQFQEWFAAQWLEQRVRQLGVSAADADVFLFQRDVLNQPQWREALEFAMESLATTGEDLLAAQIVRWMSQVDLIAAAELSHIGGAAVWASIGDELGANLRAWYGLRAPPHRDCALVAMLSTGAPDFADLLWPELERDDQALIRLCRLHEPFYAGSLGSGWETRVAGWPEGRQEAFIGELSCVPGRDGLQFAEARAVAGPPAVRVAALELLLEQSAHARIVKVVTSNVEDWPAEFYERILCRMPRAFVEPLVGELKERLQKSTDLPTRGGIMRSLEHAGDRSWVTAAQADMDAALLAWGADQATEARPHDRQGAHWSVGVMASLAMMLQPFVGDWLATWFAEKLGQGLLWEQPLIRFVESFPEAVLVPLTRAALPHPSAPFRTRDRVRALAAGGSTAVVECVVDIYLGVIKSRDDHLALRSALRELPVGATVDAVVSKAANTSEFGQLRSLVEIFAPEPRFDTNLRNALSTSQRDALRSVIRRVSDLSVDEGESGSLRPSLAVMLGALQHPEDVPLVATWVAAERQRWDEYHENLAHATTIEERRRIGQYGISWWWWYRAALAFFQFPEAEQVLLGWLTSPHLISEGANGLVDLCIVEGSLPALPSEVGGRVRALSRLPIAPMDSRVRARADAIVVALERFEQDAAGGAMMRRPLAETAVALANLNDRRAIDRLLRLDTKGAGWTLIDSFMALCRRGTVPPGRRFATALEPFLLESEGPHHSSSNDPWHAVVRALQIMLASDEPVVAIERMRRLPAQRIRSYNVRDLFDLLSTSVHPQAAAYLVELSRVIEESDEYYPNLVDALARSSERACHARILEIMLHPAPARPASAWRALQDAAVFLATTDAAFRGELLSHVTGTDGDLGHVLARIGGALGSHEAASALLARHELRPIEPIIQQLVSELTETKTPVGEGPAYNLVPRDATVLKRRLAEIVASGGPNGAVALRLLAVLRERRVEYGQPPREPLHPDIEHLLKSRVPWPLMTTADN